MQATRQGVTRGGFCAPVAGGGVGTLAAWSPGTGETWITEARGHTRGLRATSMGAARNIADDRRLPKPAFFRNMDGPRQTKGRWARCGSNGGSRKLLPAALQAVRFVREKCGGLPYGPPHGTRRKVAARTAGAVALVAVGCPVAVLDLPYRRGRGVTETRGRVRVLGFMRRVATTGNGWRYERGSGERRRHRRVTGGCGPVGRSPERGCTVGRRPRTGHACHP